GRGGDSGQPVLRPVPDGTHRAENRAAERGGFRADPTGTWRTGGRRGGAGARGRLATAAGYACRGRGQRGSHSREGFRVLGASGVVVPAPGVPVLAAGPVAGARAGLRAAGKP